MSRGNEQISLSEVEETLRILKSLGCGDEDIVRNTAEGRLYKVKIGMCTSLDDKCVHLFACDVYGNISTDEQDIKRLFIPLRHFHRLVGPNSVYQPFKG